MGSLFPSVALLWSYLSLVFWRSAYLTAVNLLQAGSRAKEGFIFKSPAGKHRMVLRKRLERRTDLIKRQRENGSSKRLRDGWIPVISLSLKCCKLMKSQIRLACYVPNEIAFAQQL